MGDFKDKYILLLATEMLPTHNISILNKILEIHIYSLKLDINRLLEKQEKFKIIKESIMNYDSL